MNQPIKAIIDEASGLLQRRYGRYLDFDYRIVTVDEDPDMDHAVMAQTVHLILLALTRLDTRTTSR